MKTKVTEETEETGLKLHVIFSHYLEYFQLTGHTLLKYTDEVTEAVYSQL